MLLGVKTVLRALRRPLQCAQPAVEGKQLLEAAVAGRDRCAAAAAVSSRGPIGVDKLKSTARRHSRLLVAAAAHRSAARDRFAVCRSAAALISGERSGTSSFWLLQVSTGQQFERR